MPDTTTSDETAATQLTGAELARITQGGNSRRTTTGEIGHQFRGVVVTRATNQSIAHNTLTAVSFSSAPVDTDGFWSAGDPTKLIIPAGLGIIGVRLSAGLDWASGTGQRRGIILKGGVGFIGQGQHHMRVTTSAIAARFTFPSADYIPVADGNEFIVQAFHFQDSGSAALDLTGGNGLWMSLRVVELEPV